MKKVPGDIIILHLRTTNNNDMMMVSEIWSATEFFSHFGLFFALLTFLHLLPPMLPNNLENQNFEKMKKMPGDIIILHMCTINENHLMYGSSDVKPERQNFLSFWTIFCPFTPLTTQKNQNF